MTKQPAPGLVEQFAAIVGARNALTDARDIAPYLTEERGLYQGRSTLVLRPGSTAEVAGVLKLANATKTAIVPQGGNTGLVGGQTPHHGEVVLSLVRLNEIRDIDLHSSTMTCEAGVVLADARARADENARLFPLSLAAEGSATIGGNLSTNAGGTATLAYGVTRDLVLGIEVVLADGRVMNALSKLKKDNTGYDLKNIFIGAEGTLGVITAAVLKLYPKPRAVETAFVGLPSVEAALALYEAAAGRAGPSLTSFELMADISVDFALRHGHGLRNPLDGKHPWYALIELSSGDTHARDTLEAILEQGMERGFVLDAALASTVEQRQAFWKIRDFLSEAQKFEGGSIKHDISVPISAVPAFMAEASAAVTKLVPGCRPVPFGHLGDGNIHFNVSQPSGADKAAFLARWDEVGDAVHAIVSRHGGSVSAEHGIGVLKRDLLPQVKDPVALAVMRSLKKMLDPNDILNPGKVL
jgi:FAD/FMN-containing dehydrogenase